MKSLLAVKRLRILLLQGFSLTPRTGQFDNFSFRPPPQQIHAGLFISSDKDSHNSNFKYPRENRAVCVVIHFSVQNLTL